MKKNAVFSLYMSLLAVWVQFLLFGSTICSSAPIIALSSLCFWLALLSRKIWINISVSVFIHICFALLLLYHQFFQDALTFSTAQNQYKEAVSALIRIDISKLVTVPVLFVLVSAVGSIVFLSRYRPAGLRTTVRLALSVPLLVLAGLNQYYYDKEKFSQYEFNAKAKFFGYPAAWLYETATYSDKQTLLKRLAEQDQPKTFDDFKDIPRADNIYIIQFESLDYSAVNSGAMPFLQKMSAKAAFYQIKPHYKKSSANSDFTVLTLKSIYNDSFSVIYKNLSPDYYRSHETLPQLLQKQGYSSSFYHGNSGRFFNRRPHIEKMGFDHIFFEEDLNNRFTSGEWGVEDADMASVINEQPQRGKNLHFWITLSSHFDFAIGKQHTQYAPRPTGLRDLYLNSVNYTDSALQSLFEHAPQNSMFIVYSDHDSGTDEARETVFMVYHKQRNLQRHGILNVNDIPQIIRQLAAQ